MISDYTIACIKRLHTMKTDRALIFTTASQNGPTNPVTISPKKPQRGLLKSVLESCESYKNTEVMVGNSEYVSCKFTQLMPVTKRDCCVNVTMTAMTKGLK